MVLLDVCIIGVVCAQSMVNMVFVQKYGKEHGSGREYGYVTRKILKYCCTLKPRISMERWKKSKNEVTKNERESGGIVGDSVNIDNQD